MTKFNRSTRGYQNKIPHVDATKNFEGAPAFKYRSKNAELLNSVASNFLEKKYYESVADNVKRLRQLIREVAKTDPEFILQVAGYCRKELNLRSISTFLFTEAANIPECKPFVRNYAPHVIARADEVTEVVGKAQDSISEIISETIRNIPETRKCMCRFAKEGACL